MSYDDEVADLLMELVEQYQQTSDCEYKFYADDYFKFVTELYFKSTDAAWYDVP